MGLWCVSSVCVCVFEGLSGNELICEYYVLCTCTYAYSHTQRSSPHTYAHAHTHTHTRPPHTHTHWPPSHTSHTPTHTYVRTHTHPTTHTHTDPPHTPHTHTRSTPIKRIPLLGGRELDLCHLFHKVQSLGGSKVVSERRLWGEVARSFKLPPSVTSASYAVRQNYMKWIFNLRFCV